MNPARSSFQALEQDETVRQDFESDKPIQPCVTRAIDLSHPARAKQREHLVSTETSAGRQRHRNVGRTAELYGGRLPRHRKRAVAPGAASSGRDALTNGALRFRGLHSRSWRKTIRLSEYAIRAATYSACEKPSSLESAGRGLRSQSRIDIL